MKISVVIYGAIGVLIYYIFKYIYKKKEVNKLKKKVEDFEKKQINKFENENNEEEEDDNDEVYDSSHLKQLIFKRAQEKIEKKINLIKKKALKIHEKQRKFHGLCIISARIRESTIDIDKDTKRSSTILRQIPNLRVTEILQSLIKISPPSEELLKNEYYDKYDYMIGEIKEKFTYDLFGLNKDEDDFYPNKSKELLVVFRLKENLHSVTIKENQMIWLGLNSNLMDYRENDGGYNHFEDFKYNYFYY